MATRRSDIVISIDQKGLEDLKTANTRLLTFEQRANAAAAASEKLGSVSSTGARGVDTMTSAQGKALIAIEKTNSALLKSIDANLSAGKATRKNSDDIEDSVRKQTAAYGAQMKLASAMRTTASQMSATGTVITAAYVSAVKTGMDFNRQLQAIQANTGLTDNELRQMRSTVEGLGTAYGGSMEKIAAGEMHAINLFHDMAAAQAITVAGSKAAVATHADEEKMINGLAKTMKEWNISTSLSNETMNGMIVAANRANTTLPQMMDHTDRIRATFANLRLPLSDMLALFATLTQHGLSASQAETQLVNVTQKIVQPTKAVRDVIDGLVKTVDPGLKKAFSLEGIQKDGFQSLFQRLTTDADKLKVPVAELIEKLFPNLRGILASLIFTGTGIQDLRNNTELFQKAFSRQTELNTAVGQSQAQLSTSVDKLHNKYVVLSEQMATSLTPGINSMIDVLGRLFHEFEQLSPEARKYIEWGGLAAGASLLLGGRVLGLASTFYQLRAAILAANAAGTAGPITAMLARAMGIGGGTIVGAAGTATVVGATGKMMYDMATNPSNPDIQYFGALGGSAGKGYLELRDRMIAEKKRNVVPAPVDVGGIADKNIENLQAIQRLLNQGGYDPTTGQKLIADRDKIINWLKTNHRELPAEMRPLGGVATPGGKSFDDMTKEWAAQQKQSAKDAKTDAKDAALAAQQAQSATEEARERTLKALSSDEFQSRRHDLNRDIAGLKASGANPSVLQAMFDAVSGEITKEEAKKKQLDALREGQSRAESDYQATTEKYGYGSTQAAEQATRLDRIRQQIAKLEEDKGTLYAMEHGTEGASVDLKRRLLDSNLNLIGLSRNELNGKLGPSGGGMLQALDEMIGYKPRDIGAFIEKMRLAGEENKIDIGLNYRSPYMQAMKERESIQSSISELQNDKVAATTDEGRKQLIAWERELRRINNTLEDLNEQRISQNFEGIEAMYRQRFENQDFAFSLTSHPVSGRDSYRYGLQRNREEYSLVQRQLSEAQSNGLQDKIVEFQRRLATLDHEYRNAPLERMLQQKDEISDSILSGMTRWAHSDGSLKDIVKNLGDRIMDTGIESFFRPIIDPLSTTVSAEILALKDNTRVMEALTNVMSGGGSSGGSVNASAPLPMAMATAVTTALSAAGLVGAAAGEAAGGGTYSSKSGPRLAGLSMNKMNTGDFVSMALAGKSIYDAGAQHGVNLGNLVGAYAAGSSLGGPIGGAIGVGIDLIGGLFGHKKAPTQAQQTPAFYNTPGGFDYEAYKYRITGKATSPDALHLIQAREAPVVHVYIDGAEVKAQQMLTKATSAGRAALTNVSYDLHRPS